MHKHEQSINQHLCLQQNPHRKCKFIYSVYSVGQMLGIYSERILENQENCLLLSSSVYFRGGGQCLFMRNHIMYSGEKKGMDGGVAEK